jgi:hypothetical protein
MHTHTRVLGRLAVRLHPGKLLAHLLQYLCRKHRRHTQHTHTHTHTHTHSNKNTPTAHPPTHPHTQNTNTSAFPWAMAPRHSTTGPLGSAFTHSCAFTSYVMRTDTYIGKKIKKLEMDKGMRANLAAFLLTLAPSLAQQTHKKIIKLYYYHYLQQTDPQILGERMCAQVCLWFMSLALASVRACLNSSRAHACAGMSLALASVGACLSLGYEQTRLV